MKTFGTTFEDSQPPSPASQSESIGTMRGSVTLSTASGSSDRISSASGRRSERVPLLVRVIVEAKTDKGMLVRLDAFTLTVNAHGGLLEMSLQVRRGQEFMLKNPSMPVQEACRVVEVRKSRDGLFSVAFEFNNPAPKFWPISLPPADWGLV